MTTHSIHYLKSIPSLTTSPSYQAFNLSDLRKIPQLRSLSEDQIFDMEVVAHVFPFKTNNYVIEQLINWEDVPNDPIFVLTFPQKDMLLPHHFEQMKKVLKKGASQEEVRETANKIRFDLNPHPAGQMEHNVPSLHGERLGGMQHKYKETILFFPSQGQTCHAYCSFCFRWPQFVGIHELKFAMHESDRLVAYLREHPEVSDVLITGGDPLVMKTSTLATYVRSLLTAELPHLRTIRIGTKALSYWPYRFLTDEDSLELLSLLREVVRSGRHLAIMAHFSHPVQLDTPAVQEAVQRIREQGVQIRTQAPLLAHINDRPEVWAKMWRRQVQMGCVPYYMFIVRDTGAQHYFGVPLAEAWRIFRGAYQRVSGLARTVLGPSMSTGPGKIQVLGIDQIHGEKVFVLRLLQGRNSNWVLRPFFAKYNEEAIWLDDLEPAFGLKKFFFEDDDSNGRDTFVEM